jgi:hypothetical protein
VFVVGIYVDNLQIVHSVVLDENGDPLDKDSFYAKFKKRLEKEWDVVDEGPMVDMLAIQAEYLPSGAIKLHQRKYIESMIERFYPHGLPRATKRAALPFSPDIRERVDAALEGSTAAEPAHHHKHIAISSPVAHEV